jgi:hypothetical protein
MKNLSQDNQSAGLDVKLESSEMKQECNHSTTKFGCTVRKDWR